MKYKKFLSATALVTLLSLSNSAFSDEMEDTEANMYIGGHYIPHFSQDKEISLLGGSFNAGYNMEGIRIESELLFTKFADVYHGAATLGVYYYADLGMEDIPVFPYVGGGIGYSFNKSATGLSWYPAYQGKLGVSYAITPEIHVHAGYHHTGWYNAPTSTALTTAKGLLLDADDDDKKTTARAAIKKAKDALPSAFTGHHGAEVGVTFHF